MRCCGVLWGVSALAGDALVYSHLLGDLLDHVGVPWPLMGLGQPMTEVFLAKRGECWSSLQGPFRGRGRGREGTIAPLGVL